IRTYSVRPTEIERRNDAEEKERDVTFTILSQPASAFVKAHLAALAQSHVRYFGTLHLALRHRVPGVRAFMWSLFHFAEAILLAARLRRDGATRLHNHFANSAATVGLLAAH